VLRRFQSYVARSPFEEVVPSSQATTLRYVCSPDGEGEVDALNQFGCVSASTDPDPDGQQQPPATSEGEGEAEALNQSVCVSVEAEPDLDDEAPGCKRQRTTEHAAVSFQIFVKTLTGQTIILWVEALDTVETLKLALAVFMRWSSVVPTDLRLIYNGSQLEDRRTLSDYRVLEGSLLHVALRLRGGGKRARVGDEDDDEESFGLEQELGDIFGEEAFDGPPQVELAAVHQIEEIPRAEEVAIQEAENSRICGFGGVFFYFLLFCFYIYIYIYI
jgi:hypothetical protein